MFFCVRGFTRDGHDFAPDAVARGAAALVVDHPLGLGVPEVARARRARGDGAGGGALAGDPTARLQVVGITGTNGKTTTAFLVRALLEAAGVRTGLLGTVTSVIGGVEAPTSARRPRRSTCSGRSREMLDGGDVACAMEVSSHALELHRADAIHWAVAVFTNLTQDHLDFHPTWRTTSPPSGGCSRPGPAPRWSTSTTRTAAGSPRDVPMRSRSRSTATPTCAPSDVQLRARRLDASPSTGSSCGPRCPGASTCSTCSARSRSRARSGVDDATIAAALPQAGRVPGRFEPVDEGQAFAVLVDYAHTPDSLENVLRAARELAPRAASSASSAPAATATAASAR